MNSIRRSSRASLAGGRAATPTDEADRTIDLRKPSAVEFGVPTPCPQCHSLGRIDSINKKAEVVFEHCDWCGHRWEITRGDCRTTST